MQLSHSAFPSHIRSFFPYAPDHLYDLLNRDASTLPLSEGLKVRNTALDWLFYDVGSLTRTEFEFLYQQTNREGSILVVNPTDADRDLGVQKFSDYQALRAEPGELLQHFCIAGVGSSDVGAAAMARNLADVKQAPVGAIVAGYGVADLVSEALGGWFFLGSANRMMKTLHDREHRYSSTIASLQETTDAFSDSRGSEVASVVSGNPDSDALLKLLLDEDRHIDTILGHSKGCLSIAYALQALALSRQSDAIAKAKQAKVVTTGAVVELPNDFSNVDQFLGSIDWFGGMNSRLGIEHVKVPGAWHHLNTRLPMHMDIAKLF